MMRVRAVLPVVLAVLTAAGCSILPKAEPQRTYTLPASPGGRPASPQPVAWSLRVATPAASQVLDSPRIAVAPQAHTLTVYAGARWSDTGPHLVRDRLADAFRDSGRVPALTTDVANLAADYELGGTLSSFQTEYDGGAPVVVVRYDALLASTRRHNVVASRRFEVREPVQGKDVPQVVEAFGRAMDRLARDVVGWTLAAAP